MKKFFNMIPGEDGACILLYGDIGDYGDSGTGKIVGELMEMQSEFKKIDVRINSLGGSVYSGIAIVNAFRSSTSDITIYIDGIAASMAAVIAFCGKPVYMSKYARLMFHSVQGGAYGTKDDLRETIQEMETLEDSLCDIIASKMKKTKEEIKNQYFDGKDHWIGADEALSIGLIDGIYDTEAVPDDSTTEQIYKIFNNRLTNKPQNQQSDMNLDEIRKRPSFANCATEADVLTRINVLETEAAKVPGLQNKLQAFEDKQKEAEEKEINDFLDAAENDERIKKAQRPELYNWMKSDREAAEKYMNSLTPKKRIMNSLQNPPAQPAASAWDKRMEEIRTKNNL